MFLARIFIFLLLLPTVCFSQKSKIFESEKPKWLTTVHPNFNATQPKEEASGFYYLMVNNQDNLETDEYYKRLTYKILNSKGVQEMSDLTIDFDPEYETVNLHHVSIVRDGEIIEKLNLGEIQVVQRESQMERFLYDGRQTIIINLTDVRSGDIIDYSYTIKGSNPVYEGKYQNLFYLQFTLPIHHYSFSIHVPQNENIYTNSINNAPEPRIIKNKNANIYTWESKEATAILYEDNVPIWYDPAPTVEITQFKNWKEVVNQYEKLYRLNDAEKTKLSTQVEDVLQFDKNNFTEEAIRFVQDEVRYLGFENGLNSHKPSKPADVFSRRYGDCKDKAFLLSEILKSQGIIAYPMLVNSTKGKNLHENLPSPNVFDHCVVQIELDENKYTYVDPTFSNQGGKTKDIYFPRYGYGLVLKPGTTELTELPEPTKSKTHVVETFYLDDVGKGATLEVETIYTGLDADFRREEFANNNIKQVQQNYTNFYSNLYPSITSEETLTYKDFRDENKLVVKERYNIPTLWETSPENEDVIYTEFYPLYLDSFIYPDKWADRKMPYALNPDLHVVHKTFVYLPEEWMVAPINGSFGGKGFFYNYNIFETTNVIEINHNYGNLNDHIAAGDMANYFSEHSKFQKNMTYQLTYNKNLTPTVASSDVSYLSIFLLIIGIGVAGFLGYKIYNNYDLPAKVEPQFERSIGSWLALLGLRLILTPFIILVQIFTTEEYFDPNMWSVLFSEGRLGIVLFLMFEMIYNSAYFIFSILAIILFFKKRTIAPRVIISILAVSLIVLILDNLSAIYLHPVATPEWEKQDIFREITRQIIVTALWIPYLIYSERVKETFVRTRKTDKPIEPKIAEETPPILPLT